ncbi:hypothetical protein ACKS0A_03905 [Histoplasma ohiense]
MGRFAGRPTKRWARVRGEKPARRGEGEEGAGKAVERAPEFLRGRVADARPTGVEGRGGAELGAEEGGRVAKGPEGGAGIGVRGVASEVTVEALTATHHNEKKEAYAYRRNRNSPWSSKGSCNRGGDGRQDGHAQEAERKIGMALCPSHNPHKEQAYTHPEYKKAPRRRSDYPAHVFLSYE